ncbi:ComEA family DNA-binding protein [Armatimonas sp.]|uniref:ComEA family DNA-binding protein n=1 Tax=Armatimonas sp. TaxID=1872638 RepID=UPI003750D09E
MFTTFTKIAICIAALTSLTCPSFAQEKPTAPATSKAVPAMPKKKTEAKKSEKAVVASVSLNKATAKELESLPGIGPAIAERIVTYRTEQGKFTELSQLREVKGIGEKKLVQLRSHLTLD